MYYTFPVWSKFYFKERMKPVFCHQNLFWTKSKQTVPQEAHCDNQKSPSQNLTLPFMTSECLWLLRGGLNSGYNDTVNKNREIYSSLATLNYHQECTGFSDSDCSRSLSFDKKIVKEEEASRRINLLRLFYENVHRRSTCETAVKFKTCQLGIYLTRRRYVH
jgi:hypothetical protein